MLANEPPVADPPRSCARIDAKPVDKDIQMKYDIAKNEDGPLLKTVKHPDMRGTEGKNQEEASNPLPVLTMARPGKQAASWIRRTHSQHRGPSFSPIWSSLCHHNVVSY